MVVMRARRRVIAILSVTLFATAYFCSPARGQLPHLPVLPPAASGQASAAAVAQHHALMMKMFDLNGDGVLEPNEIALAQSGLGKLLEQAASGNLSAVQHAAAQGAATGKGTNNLLTMFDQNGNGQLDLVELRMAQMMMATLAGGNAMRPATGFVPMNMPDEDLQTPVNPPPAKKSRRKRAERIADFAKAKNMAPAQQAAPRAKKVKARGPMVERVQPPPQKPAAVKAPAGD
jgi:hypothetical protein